MQDKLSVVEKQKPKALQLLEAALCELAIQMLEGDMEQIATSTGLSERTVIRYIKEKYVADFNTGKKILDAGRALVIEREKSIAE